MKKYFFYCIKCLLLLCFSFGCVCAQHERVSATSALRCAKSEAVRRGFELNYYVTEVMKDREGRWVILFIYKQKPGFPGSNFQIIVENDSSLKFFRD